VQAANVWHRAKPKGVHMGTKAIAVAALMLGSAVGCTHHHTNDTKAPAPTETAVPTVTSAPSAPDVASVPSIPFLPFMPSPKGVPPAPNRRGDGSGPHDAHGTAKVDDQKLSIIGGTCFSDPAGQVSIALWGPGPLQRVNASLHRIPRLGQPAVQGATVLNNGVIVTYVQGQHLSRVGVTTNAQATQDGSTYTVTGTGWQPATNVGTHFEITATCS
jgi:lipoprotein antigen